MTRTESLKVVFVILRVDYLSRHSLERFEIRISLHRVEEVEMIFFLLVFLLF